MNKKNKIMGIALAGLMVTLPISQVFAVNSSSEKVSSVKIEVEGSKAYTDIEKADARFALKEARLKLNSDYRALLKEEIAKETLVRESKNYAMADPKVSSNYEKELYSAKTLVKDESADKKILEAELISLREAELEISKDYKTALKGEVAFAKTFTKSDIYKNAGIEKNTNYNTALGIAKSTLKDGKATEEDYKLDFLNLLDERHSMDTAVNFKEALSKEVERKSEVLNSDEYEKSPIELKSDYVNLVEDAEALLESEEADNEDYDAALINIEDARKFLGVSEDTLLKEEVDLYQSVKASKEYKNATEMDKSNYEKALKDAKEILK